MRRETSVEFRIFPVTTGGSVSLSGMTITNGSAGNPTHGGGAENTNAGTLSIIGCVVSDSFGSECGGIHNNSTGTLNVTNSTVSGNGSDVNGGILNRSTGTVNVLNSAITVNRSFRFGGAGIYNRGTGTVNITDSFIANNESGNRGSGGIKNDGSGTVNVTRSTISNNFDSFDKGGGIYIGNGTVNITASTVSRNTAKGGGGIFNLAGSLIITNSTVSQNASTTDNGGGGGLRNEGSVPSATAHFSVIQWTLMALGSRTLERSSSLTVPSAETNPPSREAFSPMMVPASRTWDSPRSRAALWLLTSVSLPLPT